jgi:hypothetical protein
VRPAHSIAEQFTVRVIKKRGDLFSLPPRNYRGDIKSGNEALHPETKQFTLKNGDRVLAMVKRQALGEATWARCRPQGSRSVLSSAREMLDRTAKVRHPRCVT